MNKKINKADEKAMQAELAALRAQKPAVTKAAPQNGDKYAKDHIEIIAKSDYEDALFESEDALLQALESNRPSRPVAAMSATDDQGVAELAAAAAAIPVNIDYADYEIEVEEKKSYSDAMFSDEEAVNQALTLGTLKEPTPTRVEPAKDDKPQAKNIALCLDFSCFITDKIILADITSRKHPLRLHALGINQSFVSPHAKNLNTFDEPLFVEVPVEEESLPVTAENLAPPKSLAEKIKRTALLQAEKAKLRLEQSKSHMDEYFGRTLPDRDYPLAFKFPAIKYTKEEDGKYFSEKQVEKFFALKKNIYTLMSRAEVELERFSHTKMMSSTRLKCLDVYSLNLVEPLKSVVSLFEEKTPKSEVIEKRMQLAIDALAVIKYIVQGYKQVYTEIYESNNALYGPRRAAANKVACHILDLLCLELNLCVATRSQLAGGSIKSFNKIFYALVLYEPQMIDAQMDSKSLDQTISARALFKYYQLMVLIDGAQRPSKMNKFIRSYVKQHLSLIHLLTYGDMPSSESENCEDGYYIIDPDTADVSAPFANDRRRESNEFLFAPIFINYSILFHKIQVSYAKALALGDVKKSEVLSFLNDCVNVVEKRKHNVAYSLYEPISLNACTGFENSINYFLYGYQQYYKTSTRYDEQATAIVRPVMSRTQWYCAAEDEVFLYLKIDEARCGIQFDVGMPIVFERNNASADEEICVGLIDRVERVRDKNITVSLRKLGNDFTVVKLMTSDDNLSAADGSFYGLLCASDEGEKNLQQLLVPSTMRLYSDELILGHLPNQEKIHYLIDEMIACSQYAQLVSGVATVENELS